tara:strand:+ start:622 stop:891 length:270 start_codon:yes stop_codon:yes gene_type:complete
MAFPLLIPLISAGVPLIITLIQNNQQEGESDDDTLARLEAERIERERLQKIEDERIKAENKKALYKKLMIGGGIFLVLILLFIFSKGER